MVVCAYVISVTNVIAAESVDAAQPVPVIIGHRSAASVEIETVKSLSCGIGTQIRVADGCIYLRELLSLGREAKNGHQSKQRHNESELHGTSAIIRFLLAGQGTALHNPRVCGRPKAGRQQAAFFLVRPSDAAVGREVVQKNLGAVAAGVFNPAFFLTTQRP